MQRRVLAWSAWLVLAPAWATSPLSDGEAQQLLKRYVNAARQQSYSGAYLHQAGGTVESYRLTHSHDGNTAREKRESLDGVRWELIRHGHELIAYGADAQALLEAKLGAQRLFPELLPDNPAELTTVYAMRQLEHDRVASYDCSWIALEPRDNARYAYHFCIEDKTSLPIKISVVNGRRDVVEQFAFTQLTLGPVRDKQAFRPSFEQQHTISPERPPVHLEDGRADRPDIKVIPAGFRLMRDVRRTIAGRHQPVRHLVYSDGLARFSIFIEPGASNARSRVAGYFVRGALRAYSRPVGDTLITVVGDLPEASIQTIANSVQLKP